MICAAGAVMSVVLAVDRQTVMLRAFWILVASAALVSIGAWLLLVREVRTQRRGKAAAAGIDDDEGDHAAVADESDAAPGEGDGRAPASAGNGDDLPATRAAEVGDRGDHP